jgi:hypothetical protein
MQRPKNYYFDIIHSPIYILNNITGPLLCRRPQVKSLPIWAQMIELVPTSGHQNQTQHKYSAAVKTKIENAISTRHCTYVHA